MEKLEKLCNFRTNHVTLLLSISALVGSRMLCGQRILTLDNCRLSNCNGTCMMHLLEFHLYLRQTLWACCSTFDHSYIKCFLKSIYGTIIFWRWDDLQYSIYNMKNLFMLYLKRNRIGEHVLHSAASDYDNILEIFFTNVIRLWYFWCRMVHWYMVHHWLWTVDALYQRHLSLQTSTSVINYCFLPLFPTLKHLLYPSVCANSYCPVKFCLSSYYDKKDPKY